MGQGCHNRREPTIARGAGLLLLVLLSLIAQPTRAEPPIDPKIRSAARKLGAEGIRLFDRGKYEEALDKFDRAEKLVPAPTLGIRAARCLVKLGRLVEASERYLQVTRVELDPSSSWVLRRAKQEAQQERNQLLPRIPNLEILLRGPKGKGVEVLLDGTVVPAELIGTAYPVDPGTHDVEARRADTKVKQTTQVKERETVQVVLLMPALPKVEEPQEPDFDYTLWGWVGIGIGGGGVLAAVINGSVALAQQSDLEERCPDRSCPPNAHAAADAFDVTRVATTLGMILGGVGLAAGTTLLILAPSASGSDEKQPDDDGEGSGDGDDDGPGDDAAAALWLGLGSVGLAYRF